MDCLLLLLLVLLLLHHQMELLLLVDHDDRWVFLRLLVVIGFEVNEVGQVG